MNRRNILLDFTSLLDVTLIVIFFFVIFSHLDGEENKMQTENKLSELNAQLQVAQEREEDAIELAEQLEKEIDIVRDSNGRQASNIEELLEYAKSENIKMILDMNNNVWSVRVLCNGEFCKTINATMSFEYEFSEILKQNEYQYDDTIFCDFTFDGSIPGTASAHRMIMKGLDQVKDDYNYFYFSETDISIGRE